MALPASDSTLSTFTAADGDNLALQFWPVSLGRPRRGIVVLVHGLGEHAGRHEALAQRLTQWGFAVLGYDQCGHGESTGRRGRLPKTMRLIEDLNDMIVSARRRLAPGEKLIVMGQGLGALVACVLVLLREVHADGLVLVSPTFDLRLGRARWRMLRLMARFAPDLALGHGIAPQALSRDDEAVQALLTDPLVHDRISGRLAHFIAQSAPRVLSRASRWRWPTLLLYGDDDLVTAPAAARAFAASAPPGLVTAHGLAGAFHDVFHDVEAQQAFDALQAWLERRVPFRSWPAQPPAAGATPAMPSPPRRPAPAPSTPSSAAASPGS